MRFSNPTPTIGPVVAGLDADGNRTDQIFTASPYANARHVLAVSCVPNPVARYRAGDFPFLRWILIAGHHDGSHQGCSFSRFFVSNRRFREIVSASRQRELRSETVSGESDYWVMLKVRETGADFHFQSRILR